MAASIWQKRLLGQSPEEDLEEVELTTGIMFRGRILEYKPGKHILLRLEDGRTLQLLWKHVQAVRSTRFSFPPDGPEEEAPKPEPPKEAKPAVEATPTKEPVPRDPGVKDILKKARFASVYLGKEFSFLSISGESIRAAEISVVNRNMYEFTILDITFYNLFGAEAGLNGATTFINKLLGVSKSDDVAVEIPPEAQQIGAFLRIPIFRGFHFHPTVNYGRYDSSAKTWNYDPIPVKTFSDGTSFWRASTLRAWRTTFFESRWLADTPLHFGPARVSFGYSYMNLQSSFLHHLEGEGAALRLFAEGAVTCHNAAASFEASSGLQDPGLKARVSSVFFLGASRVSMAGAKNSSSAGVCFGASAEGAVRYNASRFSLEIGYTVIQESLGNSKQQFTLSEDTKYFPPGRPPSMAKAGTGWSSGTLYQFAYTAPFIRLAAFF